ncbi:MAG: rhomboid family intramembrane serine protease [Phycisphaerae bacterium]|nr:rhomboid family intramembrane serine protease [Phycisphaerae bacterium]
MSGGEADHDTTATVRLVIIRGPQHVGEHIFPAGRRPIGIGKQPGSALLLPGTRVSRQHCVLVPTQAGWRIEDRNSTNGLFVNRRRVTAHELKVGDRVQIGEYELFYGTTDGASRPAVATAQAAAGDTDALEDGTYRVADDLNDLEALTTGERVAVTSMTDPAASAGQHAEADSPPSGDGPMCPCCKKRLNASARVCVSCGINVRTGRSILTAEETNLDETYAAVESVIGWLSWIFWMGVYPIASEAFGTRKPYAIRGIAIVTILTSFWFLYYEWTESPKMRSAKNMMLWAGDAEPSPELLVVMYSFTNYGNSAAFEARFDQISEEKPEMSEEEVVLAAHESLPVEDRCLGEYQPHQLVTHAFLHGGILHLVGNLIFLMVFGSRVNALIGNALTVVLYPLLAVGAAVFHMASVSSEAPSPMLGASGAIMGLAGMYLVLFPIHKVHMAAWIRWGMLTGFHLSLWMWAMRGFWVVLCYIALDVFYTAMGIEDGTAHWAHLGGFIVGAAIALVMLVTKLVNARGGDIISALLGRHAWAIVGAPNRGAGVLQRLP